MAPPSEDRRTATIPPELMSWTTWLRAGVIVGMFGLLLAGRTLAHLPIPTLPIIAIAVGASLYNAILAAVAWRARDQPAPIGDHTRAWVLYVGGFLDTVALALIVLFTGGLSSPWLYFFLATSIVSSAILPPAAGRVLTAVNAGAAVFIVGLSVVKGVPLTFALFPPNFWSQSGYAAIVGLSLVGLIGLTAYAVSVPVQNARAAARFQEGLADIARLFQQAPSAEPALAAVCAHAQQWFNVDRTVITLLDGEVLVVKAAEGAGSTGLLGRGTPVSEQRSLEVEVLRRRSGFYVNHLRRSPYAAYPSVAEFDDQSILLVPLMGSLGVLGVLTMTDQRHAARFTQTILQRAGILATQAGAAVENARLLDRVREEAENAGALLRASERLTKSPELSTLLTDLNRIAAESVHCDRSTTFLWDPHREVFYFGSTVGNPPALTEAIRHLEFPRTVNPLIDRVLAGEAFIITAAQAAAQLPADLRQDFRLGASAIVPLKTEQLQGVMTVSYLDPASSFSAELLWMLHGIARHAALAIERARLIAQEREATATAEALVALGRELSATLDRRHVLSRIPQMAATAAGADFGVLSAWDRAAQRVRILGVHGFPPDATQQLLQLSIGTPATPLDDAFTRQRCVEIPSPQQLPQLPPGLMEQWRISSLLTCLIGPVEQSIGSLTIGYRQRTGPFSAAQKRVIDGIAQHATVVFDNIRLVEDLQQANQVKSDFLSTVSHELRTPLNAIIGYTDLLRERALGAVSAEQLEVLNIVSKKGVQLLDLINTTLDLTRLEAGQDPVVLSEFSLADLLDEIGHDLADEAAPAVEFVCAAAPDIPPVTTDRTKLKTVIKNVVHNALKFTRRGQVDVHAARAALPDHVQVVVRDTGVGIAAENVTAIFEMFRQLEPANRRQFGGVGLGLYIVHRLLDLIRGEILVESEPGKGSVFVVTIPVRLSNAS